MPFNTILSLFDNYIYSKEITPESDGNFLTSYLAWENIQQYFPEKDSFKNSLNIYASTIIRKRNDSLSFENIPLVQQCTDKGNGIELIHNKHALQIYLSHNTSDKIDIINDHVKGIFVSALKKYQLNAEILYQHINKERTYECRPEDFKAELGINYTNAMLKRKILSPIEKKIKDLYDIGDLPFYIECAAQRSIYGTGSKVIKIKISTTDYLHILKQRRCRNKYLQDIVNMLKGHLPFDYPFFEENLKTKDDETISKIYHFIKNIEKDPYYKKIDTSFLIKYKLQQDYGVNNPYE